MRVSRKIVKIIKTEDDGNSHSEITSQENISFMWELTEELWSLSKQYDAEQRLQRNITNLYKQQG